MRIRTLAAAVVAAAGLSVTLTGAASATPLHDPPPGDVFVVSCSDGRAEVRPATEAERAEVEEMRAEMRTRAVEPGAVERAVPGRPDVVGARRAEAGEGRVIVRRALPAGATPAGPEGRAILVVPDGTVPGDRAEAVCAVPARPLPVEGH